MSVLLGNGNGTFQPGKVYPVGFEPLLDGGGDFNGDGMPDIITANRGDNTVSVLLGNGDGTFEPQKPSRWKNSSHGCGGDSPAMAKWTSPQPG